MPLAQGTKLGPYEILGAIGSGGMGEVYRARDTRLDRDVAIKVLPSHVAFDPEARARFEREAKAVAALSHPNILAIHDVGRLRPDGATADQGDAVGTLFAVTELLNGETLRARLGGAELSTALPARKAVDIAIQIARGLAAAHGKGIIHRDLKPENVFLTTDGHAKILDFGLAKAAAPSSATTDASSATQLRATDPGTVMGTAGYMAPEQVKGHQVDHRADIFALGCVFYEMLGGHRAFHRDTVAETMTSVLKDEPPDLGTLGPPGSEIPAALGSIVRHCLEKQPDDRFQSARDLTFALESSSGSSPAIPSVGRTSRSRSKAMWPWAAATVLVAAITGLGVWLSMRGAAPAAISGPAIRAELSLPGFELPFLVGKDDSLIALSPDGRWLASVGPAHATILLRNLETGESRTLVEGGEVGEPFFSPDGQFLAFVQGGGGTTRTAVWGSIKKIAVTGGAATVIADGIIGIKGGAWSEDGYIYYCPAPGMGLWRASADTPGTPERLTDPDPTQGEKTHRHPFVLPGGRAVLYTLGTSRITTFDDARIEVLDLRDRSRHKLVDGGTAPMYLPTGHLVYERAGQLLAVKFDPDSLSTSGAPVVVADGVANLSASGTSYHTFSKSGLLMFIPLGPKPVGQFVALDRQGKADKMADAPTILTSGSLSPDGRRLAIDPDGATQQIGILDLSRNLSQPFTFEWDNAYPLWTPDGSRLIFRSNVGGGARRLFWQAADGSGKPEALTKAGADEIPTSIHDKLVVYETFDAKSGVDIWILSLDDRIPRPLVQTPFDESGARFSPDGHWLTYQSNQSGRWEIWLQRFPAAGSRVQVSQAGGTRAMWMPDNRTIVFQQGNDVMSATVSEGGTSTPVKLSALEPNDILLDVTRDSRILIRRTTTPPAPSLALIVNWFDHVRRVTAQSGPTR